MGVSYSVDRDGYDGGIRAEAKLTASFDTSYTAGGEPLTAADARMGRIDDVVLADNVTESGYIARYDQSAGTIVMYEGGGAGATLSEVAGSTDLSSESVTLLVRGSGSP